MKVLVSDGADFIGSNVAGECLSAGCQVTVRDDLSTGFAENLEGRDVRMVRGEIRDAASVDEAMRGVDAVLHQRAGQ
jgi:nucleoside-diphosphate-sugar epimerase